MPMTAAAQETLGVATLEAVVESGVLIVSGCEEAGVLVPLATVVARLKGAQPWNSADRPVHSPERGRYDLDKRALGGTVVG